MRISIAQINPTVGDLSGNTRKIIEYIGKAKAENSDLVVFPELVITGYPPEDLVLKPQFITDNLSCLNEIVKASKGIAAYVGFVDRVKGDLFNSGAFIINGKIRSVYHKISLPNYSVFDEKRYFKEGKKPQVVTYKGVKIGLGICEDIWDEKGPYLTEAKLGAKLILNINASPYNIGKIKLREKMIKERAIKTKATLVYINMVGGQDELIFDGGSMVFNSKGKLVASAKQYKEELLTFNLEEGGEIAEKLDELSEIYSALLLGVSDYVNKNRFSDVVIGLSGGIDSALTLAIAKDALGSSKVHALFMPSPYTSEQSRTDSQKLSKNLGVEMIEIPIEELFSTYVSELEPHFKGKAPNITEENLQARIRGNILMAFSNKFGWLVLNTGNKSETSTGYCTLYGDMAGGYNVLKDVPKMLVYKLSDWLNRDKEIIPKAIIERVPTAELKPNQKDQDTLPPYDQLDAIIKAYVEDNKSTKQIAEMGFDEKTVKKVISMIDHSEYKRRQGAPGPRITPRAFGKDWRLPITNRYSA